MDPRNLYIFLKNFQCFYFSFSTNKYCILHEYIDHT
jgi:hypothetical protein